MLTLWGLSSIHSRLECMNYEKHNLMRTTCAICYGAALWGSQLPLER